MSEKRINPDPAKYVMGENGWELKPRQCPKCKELFTPHTLMQVNCYKCVIPNEIPLQHIIPFVILHAKKLSENDFILRKKLACLRVQLVYARKHNLDKRISELTIEIATLKVSLIDHRLKRSI